MIYQSKKNPDTLVNVIQFNGERAMLRDFLGSSIDCRFTQGEEGKLLIVVDDQETLIQENDYVVVSNNSFAIFSPAQFAEEFQSPQKAQEPSKEEEKPQEAPDESTVIDSVEPAHEQEAHVEQPVSTPVEEEATEQPDKAKEALKFATALTVLLNGNGNANIKRKGKDWELGMNKRENGEPIILAIEGGFQLEITALQTEDILAEDWLIIQNN